MGAASSRPTRHKTAKLLILGRQFSGKSTLINYLKTNSFTVVNPTINFTAEKYNRYEVIDVGGSAEMMQLWSEHYSGTQTCLFVVDGTSPLDQARDLIKDILGHTDMRASRFAVVVTKIDQPGVSQKADYYRTTLQLDKDRVQEVFMFCGLDGQGCDKIAQWLDVPKQP
ncbi:Putative nucleoside triphosphate hydrolase superfamily, P-loop domain protein [Giardia duodenalis]|uniref:Putative nucleoside triphosphate hydrolase superfamily, P-loop domain protein n=1 Tax=Giardia intestinalis TaxID=5741 RepID=V6TG20_GIAIN|nr:Putative nucleoside triphosphate hydrolase superfamily, P-loop domain protein [Giardia intestinalis]